MKRLEKNWLTEGLIDFEYKKYIVLAYLKYVREKFDVKKLFPFMSDLVFHYRNLLSLKENKSLLYENFPQEISRADFESLRLIYHRMVEDDALMSELDHIVTFCLPKFKEHLSEGKDIYDYAEQNIEIAPVGLAPLRVNEGYLFIREFRKKSVRIFEYQIGLFRHAEENYRGIHTQYIDSYKADLSNTYESVKVDLVKRMKKYANPATYVVESKTPLPFSETLLPVAKRLLVKYISPGTA